MKLKAWCNNKLFHCLGMVQEPWYTLINKLANAWILLRNPEKVTHPGTLYSDKTFYVIRDLPSGVGLAGWYDRVVGYMLRAKKKGWIPIVVPPKNSMLGDEREGRGNWYSYFSVISPYNQLDVGKFANTVEAVVHGVIHKRYNRSVIRARHDISKNICLNLEANKFVESHLCEIFGQIIGRPLVGVYFRGTDYRNVGKWKPIGHAAVPRYEVFCEKVENALRRWGVPIDEGRNLFVVTEEQEALDYLVSRYPLMSYVKKPRFVNFNFGTALPYQTPGNLSFRENNLLYLVDIYALARCDYLIGGVNGGVLMALNLNGNRYRGVQIMNTGVN